MSRALARTSTNDQHQARNRADIGYVGKEHNEGMQIEIMHIDDCPNWQEAGARASRVLTSLGLPDKVTYRLIRSPEDAVDSAFGGSPTLTVNGADLFPGDHTPDLACRIYRTPAGLAGLPTEQQIADALEPVL